jgi:hypothetical protein
MTDSRAEFADFLMRAIPVLVRFFREHSKHGLDVAVARLGSRLDERFDVAEAAIRAKPREASE